MRYVIGSGWWCSGKETDSRAKFFGDDTIRGQKFHQLWYEAINRYASPEKIIIVDSNSPLKPAFDYNDERLEFVSLNVNAGHSTDHRGKFCGYTRAIHVGLEFASQCDADYYVFIEQDALIYGEGIIEYCIDKMKTPYMFGAGVGTAGILQQSFFIIRQDAIWHFRKKLKGIKQTDNVISPEEKFHFSCGYVPSRLTVYLHQKSPTNIVYNWLDWQYYKYLRNWTELPVGFGRVRPVDFSQEYFYFQHGSEQELASYLALTDIDWP